MLFKAKLATTLAIDSNSGKFRQHTTNPVFVFSKTRIFFPKKSDGTQQDFFILQDVLKNGDKYELVRLHKYENIETWTKDSKFQAKFSDTTTLNIVPNFWNGILLRIAHKRYWVQRNWDWFLQTIIATLIGAIMGIIGTGLGYHEGYESGLKEGLLHHQASTPHSP